MHRFLERLSDLGATIIPCAEEDLAVWLSKVRLDRVLYRWELKPAFRKYAGMEPIAGLKRFLVQKKIVESCTYQQVFDAVNERFFKRPAGDFGQLYWIGGENSYSRAPSSIFGWFGKNEVLLCRGFGFPAIYFLKKSELQQSDPTVYALGEDVHPSQAIQVGGLNDFLESLLTKKELEDWILEELAPMV